jgi:predicted transcriptional regulator
MSKLEKLTELNERKGTAVHLFSVVHFYLVLKYLSDKKKPIGRYKLGKKLGLGRGSMRTVINRLSNDDLIKSESRKGHIITSNGQKILDQISNTVIDIQTLDYVGKLTVSEINVGCQVRDSTNSFNSSLRLRDEAIKVGASGVTTLIYRDNKFVIFGMEDEFDIKKDYESLYNELINKFKNLETNDLIIIGTAESEILAKIGCLSAIFSEFIP